MIPSPAELQYFIEVAQTENVSRAAERLGIRQPTLSQAIQRLESSFGVPLLIRNKNGVKLTRAGTRLVAQARAILSEWEKLRSDVLHDEDVVSGRYTIGCHPSVAIYSLPHFLPGLLAEYPKLELRLSHDLSRRVTEDVISFKIDFGIVVNPPPHPDLVIKLLCKDEVSFWACGKPGPLTDPAAETCVLICDPDLMQTQALIKEAGQKGYRFSRVLHSSNLEVVSAMTASGAGIGVLPARVATLQKGLHTVGPAGGAATPIFHDRVCLVYRADAQRSKSGRFLAKRIEEQLKAAFA